MSFDFKIYSKRLGSWACVVLIIDMQIEHGYFIQMTRKNPIAIKLQSLLTDPNMTKEKICVVADIRYPALANVFVRGRVSKLILKSLLWHRIINKDDVDAQKRFEIENGLYGEKRGGKREKRKSVKRIDSDENRGPEENSPDKYAA